MKNSESKNSKKPLVIYVSENDHGDMSYGSIMEQIIKDCHAKGLSTQTFSEFPSQTKKVETQKLTNQSSDLEIFQATTKFLDEQFIEMGSIDGRYPIFQKSWDSYPDTLTPSQLFENQRSQIDNPELLQILEEEIEARKKEGNNKAGKEEGGDLWNFNRLRTCLHYEQIHQIMAVDVQTKLKDDVDVVIMVAGSPHIPGLDSQLDRFRDCPKFVVGNVLTNPKDLEERLLFGGTPTACAKVGQLVGFDVDPITKEATIPEAVKLAIDARGAFLRIDEPQENLLLSPEVRSKMSDAFAQAHIDYINSDLLDEKRKPKFLSRLAKGLSVEESELNAAIEDRERLSTLFSKLKDEDLVKFNWDKDGLAVIKPTDLSTTSIQEYCDNIDFRGVMVVDDGKGNQTKVSNYHKGTQVDPEDHSFATHSVSKLIGGVTICKMIADGVIPKDALDKKLELSEATLKKLPAEILKHLEEHNVTLRDAMTHHSGLGGYLDPELKEGQPGYGTRELGYGINGYSGYVRQQLEKGEEVEVPNSPQDYLKYAERITYEYGKHKYSDLGIMLASLSAEHHYNKERDPSEHKSFEEIVREQLIIPAGVEKFSAQMPVDAVCHSDDPIAPYITGTAGCGYWTNLDGLVKIGQQIGKMWREDETFRGTVQNCGQEFYDEEKQIIKHPGGIDSSKTLLSVDLASGSVVVTEERRLGSDFPFPGWGVVTTARNLDKEQSNQKQPQVQAGNLNAVDAARNFKDDPEIIERYTVFNPRNVYRSVNEVLELYDATGVDIMPRGDAVNPDDIIGVGLICFRPERIAKQLTVASVNMQAKIDEESFPRIVDDVFGNYVAKEMASVVPQVNQMRAKIEENVAEASKALQENPAINTEENEVLTKVKEARDKIRQEAEGKIPQVSEEFINAMAAKYATDLLYNESPEIFKLVEDAVARGMGQAAKEGKYEPLSQHQNNERVAIVVAGGPASGKTQATEMALHSLVDSRDVMAFSTDQLRTLVSPGETGGPAFTDLEANLVFRQIIGKMDRAMKSDIAPTILSEGTSLNPGAINHLLTGGAEVHASLISIPAEVALTRAGKRAASDKAADQGRSYSDEYLLGLHRQDGTALPNITNQLQGKNVQLSIFDNNVERGQSPELIGRMNLQTMEMEIYNVQKLAELEQKGKIDPTQSKDQGMYEADDKLPENNISFLTDALKKFKVTFRDGEMGEEYAASKPGEKLTITNQAVFDSRQENPHDKALTSPFLEEAKKAEQESGDTWVKKLGLEDKAEKPRSFLEAAKAGKYGNIGSKGGAHEL